MRERGERGTRGLREEEEQEPRTESKKRANKNRTDGPWEPPPKTCEQEPCQAEVTDANNLSPRAKRDTPREKTMRPANNCAHAQT